MIILSLPWPPKDLSPNARAHYMRVAAAKKKYRADCRYATLAAKAKASGPQLLSFVFYPPHNRRYDKDNLIAQMKAGIDGISDALGIDDSQFHYGPTEIGVQTKGGLVRVFISSNDTTEDSNAQTTNSTVSAQIQRVEAAQAFAAGRDRRLATQDQHGWYR